MNEIMNSLFFRLVAPMLLLALPVISEGQELQELLEQQTKDDTRITSATFKATRILNGHSIERMPEGQLDFRISHRFGRINGGAYELFGLDQAHIHLSLEYGFKNWIMAGFGRGTFEKTVDGFIKISPVRQSTGARNIPVSISWMTGVYVNGLRWSNPEIDHFFWQRLSYAHQLLIARKFSPAFSLQLLPSYLHRNFVETGSDPNDLFALGAGSRIKLTTRISFNTEYFYLFKPDNGSLSQPLYNPLSLGFDIETGGHVFQIIMTNSLGMRENGFLGQTTGSWLNGDIHLGFNISRVFQIR
jgi:hypothetical protein